MSSVTIESDCAPRFADPSDRVYVLSARRHGAARFGLALSAGGARGFAHVGVIQVLEEHHIPIDIVAGCSMGAYVGSVWASGYNGYEMETLARQMEDRRRFLKLLDPVFPPWRGLVRGLALLEHLKRSIGDVRFCDLGLPLKVVATDAETHERVIFEEGQVAKAVLASSAIPGVVVPVEIGGRQYFDGGLSDPLPVDLLRDLGTQYVIAVNVLPSSDPFEVPSRLNLSPTIPGDRTKVGFPWRWGQNNWVAAWARSFNRPRVWERAAEAARRADLTLWPEARDGRWHEFSRPEKYIALGRRAAEENLETIRRLTGKEAL